MTKENEHIEMQGALCDILTTVMFSGYKDEHVHHLIFGVMACQHWLNFCGRHKFFARIWSKTIVCKE